MSNFINAFIDQRKLSWSERMKIAEEGQQYFSQPQFTKELKPVTAQQHPELYFAAQSAAKKMNEPELALFIKNGHSSVSIMPAYRTLLISPLLVDGKYKLNSDEIENIVMHEIRHSQQYKPAQFLWHFINPANWFCLKKANLGCLTEVIVATTLMAATFTKPGILFDKIFALSFLYNFLERSLKEYDANNAIVHYGDPQHLISGLYKVARLSLMSAGLTPEEITMEKLKSIGRPSVEQREKSIMKYAEKIKQQKSSLQIVKF